MDFLRVAGAQVNLVVGDLEGNRDRIVSVMSWADEVSADVLLLPELAVCGYPPEDLVLKPAFVEANRRILSELAGASGRALTVVGFVDRAQERSNGLPDDAVPLATANAAALICEGELRGVYQKVLLPNYGVFDEDRYFVPGGRPEAVWDVGGVPVGVSICEDVWVVGEGPPVLQAQAGARILLNINGSPFHKGKGAQRAELLSRQAAHTGLPIVYLNLVGGQDELVFDGQSMVFDGDGHLLYRAAQFQEELFCLDLPLPEGGEVRAPRVRSRPVARAEGADLPGPAPVLESEEAEVYEALLMGVRDYAGKNGFDHAVVGLSGGIDSSLTAVIAADALGPDHVWGVAMPARYSSPESVRDAQDLAARLGCRFDVVPVDDIFAAALESLQPVFKETRFGVAEENLQARIRGMVLMAISNKFGGLVLASGNKSEMAMGYSTLYGDMVGGFAVLKDVFKTLVYRLAEWRNRQGEQVIPESVLAKAPSAELRPDQKDTDTLPPYEVLDPILERYVELDRSAEEMVAEGFDPEIVRRVVRTVDRNEYKRRQGAPGVKITTKAFGRDRRLPITNYFR